MGATMTVRIEREELDAAGMRALAARDGDARRARRLLALALVLEGRDRADAARSCGMDRQTLRDWVLRYNRLGVEGLADRPHGGGTPARLTEAELGQLAAWVRRGPDLKEDGVVRWRLSDLRQRISDRFFAILTERSVGRLLASMGFSHVSARPRSPKADAEAQATHKKTSPRRSRPQSRRKRGADGSKYGGRTKPESASRAA